MSWNKFSSRLAQLLLLFGSACTLLRCCASRSGVCYTITSSRLSSRMYSRRAYNSYYGCGFLWLSRCSRVRYSTSSQWSYRTAYIRNSVCCPGYSQVGTQCRPVCSSGCYNGGTCVSPNTCSCAPGWTGRNCLTPVCSPDCSNGGTCVSPNVCTCTSRWMGVDCRTPTCTDGDVRTRDSVSESEGHVEVCLDQTWASVCGDSWDNVDAGVACRQLGFSRFNAVAQNYSVFDRAPSSSPVHLDEVNCTGAESRLIDCTHTVQPYCSQYEDAGVQCNTTLHCENGKVQLVGGASALKGRVEMCWNETWGTVCDQRWSSSEARVVCWQLGYSRQGATPLQDAYSGVVLSPVLSNGFVCSGTEANLTECTTFGLGMADTCGHRAGVICRRGCSTWDIRLVNGRTEFEGRVETCWNKEWGTVCDNSWDEADARVVCRQLGYTETISVLRFWSAPYGHGTGQILLDNVECYGNETSLHQCAANLIGDHNCSHYEDAGVRCSQCVENSVRLVGGASDIEGRVEVCLGGGWGTVCGEDWTTEAATVVCRQLGLPVLNVKALRGDLFDPVGKGVPTLLSNVSCTSRERSLTDCRYEEQGSCGTNHTDDAGVICSKAPPQPPLSVILSSITASSVIVSWTEPFSSANYTDVLNYQVNCTTNSPYPAHSHVTADNITVTTNFYGLHPYTSYTCCVTSVGVNGVGGENCQMFRTMEAVPGSPPTNIIVTISSASLNLTWSPPLVTNGNIIRYQAQLVDSVTGDVTVSMVTMGQVEWVGLLPYRTYKYRVAAATAVGLGPFSENRTVQTSEAAPSQSPVNVTVTVTSSTTAHVTWSPPPPEAQNGVIRQYEIYLEDNSTSVSYTSYGPGESYVLTGLHPGNQYRVGVAAYTVEIGPMSDYTDFVTLEDVPSVIPTVGMVTRISATEVQVSWDPLSEEDSLGSSITYLVRYRVHESRVTRNTEETSTIIEVEESNTIISKLEPHLAYSVAVAAKNKRGAGEFSDEIIADIFENSRFRVHLSGHIECSPWTSTGISEKMFHMTAAISSNMQSSCNCNYTAKYIARGSVNCGDKSTNRVILEATFVSSTTKSSHMRDLLQKWVDTEPKVLVQGVQLTVAPCSVLPLDEGGEECPIYSVAEPHASNGLSVPLIGGVAGGLVLLICGTLLLILIVVGAKRRHSKREQSSGRRSHDLRLNITLAPGEGTVGTAGTNLKEKELLKEDESKLKDEDHIYEEPSKYLDANFTEPPPSYCTANSNQKASSSKVGSKPSPTSDETRCNNEYETVPSLPPQVMPPLRTTPKFGPPQSPAEYSEPVPHPHSQVPVAAGASKTTYQPLLPPPRQPKDIPLDSPNYQSVGPPAGYAAPRVSGKAAMTRNDVPQPTTGGLRGVRGKPPNLDRTKAFQENQEHDEYVKMKTPARH